VHKTPTYFCISFLCQPLSLFTILLSLTAFCTFNGFQHFSCILLINDLCFIRILGCGYRRDRISICTVRPDCSYRAWKSSTKATKIVTYVNLFVSQNSLSSISVSLLPSVCLCFITADFRCLWCLSDFHLFVLSLFRLNSARFDKNSELLLRCLSVCLSVCQSGLNSCSDI
jgi:hypothetical protein